MGQLSAADRATIGLLRHSFVAKAPRRPGTKALVLARIVGLSDMTQVELIKVLGEQPRPRALALGLSDVEASALTSVFPTVRVINQLGEVAQVDWDVLVTREDVPSTASQRLFVLAAPEQAYRSMEFGAAHVPNGAAQVGWRRVTSAVRFAIPSGLPAAVLRLVESDLAPVALNRATNGHSHWSLAADPFALTPEAVKPFLVASDGAFIAGSFRRAGDKADCWCLPNYVENLVPWAKAAYQVWQEMAPHAFPSRDLWTRQSRWRVAAERSLLEQITDLERERNEALASLDNHMLSLQADLAAAEAAVDARERVLLTGQGDALKAAVSQALGDLGFGVEDMDEKWPVGRKREDLRLTLPDKTGWTALVEVRGYKKGAAVNDLLRIGRFMRLFAQEEGRPPDASWYVVNHFIDQNPDEREAVLASNSAEVKTFAEDGGLVIDTVVLFQAWVVGLTGTAKSDDLRLALASSTGRLALGPQ